jgi:uncharacterized protein
VAKYFADTAFWIALANKHDQYHKNGVAWRKAIARTGSRIVTTEAVLWEWLNALSGVNTRMLAGQAYGLAHQDRTVEVVPFTPELIDAASQLYRQRPDKQWSLTDCCSFLVMQERGIVHALTTDHHFEQGGFIVHMLDQPPE